MGQYFIIANLDKKEYIKPTLLKLWEICANNDARILPYLLATNNPDGTGILKLYRFPPEEARRKCEEETGFECEVVFYEKNLKLTLVEPKLKYFGRWCGDRIAVVGDYADRADNYEGPSFGYIENNFKDITEEAVREFNWFIGSEELKIGSVNAISPDMVLTASKVYENPRIVK